MNNDLIYTLIIGAVSGWLAGQIKQGFGFGLFGNIVVGILGAYVGQWFFRSVIHVSLGGSLMSTIVTSVIGALVLLFVIGLFNKK